MLPHRLQLPRLVAGRTAQIHLTGGLAQARLALGRGPSLATGPMACPSMLQGGCLELDSPVLWGASPTDDDGWATVSVTVPATVPPGTSVALQAVEHDPTGAQAPAVHAAEALSVAPAGSPHVLGHLTPFPDASSHAPGFLLGGAVQVPDPVTLTDLGVYALAAGVQGQLALYADAGGAPGDLVAHTAPFSTTPGQMSAAVVSPASLSPGTYWVMGVYDAPMSLGIDFHNDEPVHYVPHTLGQPLPDPFPEGLDYDGQAFNHHLRVY